MAVHSFRPVDSVSTIQGTWTLTTGTSFVEAIDDDPDSPTLTDRIQNTLATSGSQQNFEVKLSAVPADWGTISTHNPPVKVYVEAQGWVNDSTLVSATIYNPGAAGQLCTGGPNSIVTASEHLNSIPMVLGASGLVAANWSDAILRIGVSRTTNMGADIIAFYVIAVEVDVTYTPAASSGASFNKHKAGGVFTTRPIKHKAGGVFTTRPIKTKVSGVWK